jgi:hypothetical protein
MLFEFILQPLGVLARMLVTSGMAFRQINRSYKAFGRSANGVSSSGKSPPGITTRSFRNRYSKGSFLSVNAKTFVRPVMITATQIAKYLGKIRDATIWRLQRIPLQPARQFTDDTSSISWWCGMQRKLRTDNDHGRGQQIPARHRGL